MDFLEDASTMRTLCDACESAAAIVFCAADEAALCRACDEKVHMCNKLASRHIRVGLASPSDVPRCDICENAPAFFYCETDGTSLCLQCDMIVHVGGKRTHGRYLLFRQRVEFPGDKPGLAENLASQPLDAVETKRGQNSLLKIKMGEKQQNHRMPTPEHDADAHAKMDAKMIDLNMKPQRIHEHGSNNQDAYAKYVKEYYVGTFGVNVQTYNQKHLKNTAITEDSADGLWWFQVCTGVAYFQVAPANDSIRSSKVDTRYHLDLCENVFGEGIFPDVSSTNICYGGTKISGQKIMFTNGSQDPWRHASKQISTTYLPSYTVSCYNCGHGTNMRGCPQSPLNLEGNEKNCADPDAVRKIRQKITGHVDLWLSECQHSL